jgi:hypothetical protein
LLPKRARIFSTSRSIVMWGKKEKRGWWLRRVNLGALYDAGAVGIEIASLTCKSRWQKALPAAPQTNC